MRMRTIGEVPVVCHLCAMDPTSDSPRRATRGGAYVLAFTGVLILVLVGMGAESVFDYILLGLAGVALIWASFRLARFVRDHGGEIGEARFDTSNKD